MTLALLRHGLFRFQLGFHIALQIREKLKEQKAACGETKDMLAYQQVCGSVVVGGSSPSFELRFESLVGVGLESLLPSYLYWVFLVRYACHPRGVLSVYWACRMFSRSWD